MLAILIIKAEKHPTSERKEAHSIESCSRSRGLYLIFWIAKIGGVSNQLWGIKFKHRSQLQGAKVNESFCVYVVCSLSTLIIETKQIPKNILMLCRQCEDILYSYLQIFQELHEFGSNSFLLCDVI